MEPNPHGVVVTFGKHKGTLLTRTPASYIRWMANTVDLPQEWKELAKAEIKRRGNTLPTLELSGHAIDRASLHCRGIWKETARDDQEGLYSWLMRVTGEALAHGEKKPDGAVFYLGMKFVIEPGEEFPVLKTVMRK